MHNREWSRSRFWLCHFLHNRHQRLSIPWKSHPAQPPSPPVVQFLAAGSRLTPIQSLWLIHHAAASCSSDPAYIQSLRLLTKELAAEDKLLARLLARCRRQRRPQSPLASLRHLACRILGIRFKLSELLLGDLTDIGLYHLAQSATSDPAADAACRQIIADKRARAAFHAERLTLEFADFNFIRRNLRRLRLRLHFAAQLALALITHHRLIRASSPGPIAFLRDRWSHFNLLLERMVPYRRDQLLAALTHQRERPYDKTISNF